MIPPLEIAIDRFNIAHVVAWGVSRPGGLITECGVAIRWKDLTFSHDDVATCMTCLVSVSRQT